LGGGLGHLFFNLLYSFRLRQGDKYKICRIPSKRRALEGRSFYRALRACLELCCEIELL